MMRTAEIYFKINSPLKHQSLRKYYFLVSQFQLAEVLYFLGENEK